MSQYFMGLDMKEEIKNLSKGRAQALQEKRNAKDLRIAYLGSRHLAMAKRQKKELQELFDEDDILRTQGQDSIANHTQDTAERLEEKLDERDHVDEDELTEEILSEQEQLNEEEKREDDTIE